MPKATSAEKMEKAKAAYDTCSGEFASALNEVKTSGRGTPRQLERIVALNKECDELLYVYLDAIKRHYGRS
jgi:hypothetical protein